MIDPYDNHKPFSQGSNILIILKIGILLPNRNVEIEIRQSPAHCFLKDPSPWISVCGIGRHMVNRDSSEGFFDHYVKYENL
jgi:hypothetical protein